MLISEDNKNVKDYENSRRLMAVPVTVCLIVDQVKQGWRLDCIVECIEGIPKDAVYIRSFTDYMSETVYFVFYHPTFSPVPLDEEIPHSTIVVFRRTSPPDPHWTDWTDTD